MCSSRCVVISLAPFVAAAVLVTGGCSEPLEFAEWTIPVAEGTEVIGYPAVPLNERDDARVALTEDVVIRSRGDDERYLLYRPRDLDIGAGGEMYVLDAGNSRVLVYDRNGEHLRTLGRRGQGPGELLRPTAAAIVGDRYVVNDGGTRLLVWSTTGEYLEEHIIEARLSVPRPFVGLSDAPELLATFTRGGGGDVRRASAEGRLRYALARVPIDGGEPRILFDLPAKLIVLSSDSTPLEVSEARMFAAAPDGISYFTEGDQYQILSLDGEGAARWALRVAWERQPYSEEEIAYHLANARKDNPGLTRADVEIAEAPPTLSHMQVDGHGHLYVFLRTFRTAEDAAEELPVDVYDAGGNRLFAGTVPEIFWRAVSGDFVYAFVYDRQADEQTIVRFRLDEPF